MLAKLPCLGYVEVDEQVHGRREKQSREDRSDGRKDRWIRSVRGRVFPRSEEHTSELQSHHDLVCRLLLEKKKSNKRRKMDHQRRRQKQDMLPGRPSLRTRSERS